MNSLLSKQDLDDVLQLGKGQYIEFKKSLDKSFAKEPYKYVISSKIRCIHFNDNKRVDILDKKVIDRGIIGNIEYAVAYIKERVPVRYEIKDLKRKEYPEYPIEAYREAIVNAIIHFDYFLGDTIAIEKLKSSIVINNKGKLLFPESQFGKRSEARNRLLADLLARTDFMEKAGTGIKRVRDACKTNSNNIHFNFTDAFWVTIETNVTDNVVDSVVDSVVDNRLKKIIELVTEDNQISASQMAKILNITSRTVQRDIGKLKNQNKLKRVGSEKGGHWVVVKEKL